MKKNLIVVAMGLFVIGCLIFDRATLQVVAETELRSHFGMGDCENTKTDPGACSGVTCTASNGKGIKKTGKNITPAYKYKVGKGESGFDACTEADKKDCFKIEECTAEDCSSGCADKTLTDDEKKANEKPTTATKAGKACTGT